MKKLLILLFLLISGASFTQKKFSSEILNSSNSDSIRGLFREIEIDQFKQNPKLNYF